MQCRGLGIPGTGYGEEPAREEEHHWQKHLLRRRPHFFKLLCTVSLVPGRRLFPSTISQHQSLKKARQEILGDYSFCVLEGAKSPFLALLPGGGSGDSREDGQLVGLPLCLLLANPRVAARLLQFIALGRLLWLHQGVVHNLQSFYPTSGLGGLSQ